MASSRQAAGVSPELELKIWKQVKLIDFLEECEEVDVKQLGDAYAHLGSLQSNARDTAAAKEALHHALAVRGSVSSPRSVASPEQALKIWEQLKLTDLLEEKEEIDMKQLEDAYTMLSSLQSDAGDTAAAERSMQKVRDLRGGKDPAVAAAAAAGAAAAAAGAADAPAPPGSLNFKKELVLAASRPQTAVNQFDAPSDPAVAAAAAVEEALAPLLQGLQSKSEASRSACETLINEGAAKVQLQVVNDLETRLQEDLTRASGRVESSSSSSSSSPPDYGQPSPFVFWHQELLAETEALLQRQLASTKQSLHQQVESERSAWLQMAQEQLDSVQAAFGSSEATMQVEILLQKYHQADNNMLKWELSLLSKLQSDQSYLLQLWHSKSKEQLEAEATMRDIQRKARYGGALGGGGGSPQQQMQLTELQQQLKNPSSLYAQNQTDVKMLQRQIEEWKKVAKKTIESDAEAEMRRWKEEIQAQSTAEDKIALIESIEKQRAAAGKAVTFQDTILNGDAEKEKGELGGAKASGSPQLSKGDLSSSSPKGISIGIGSPPKAVSFSPLNLAEVEVSPSSSSPDQSPGIKLMDAGAGAGDDPISPKGQFSSFSASGDGGGECTPPMSAQEAERAVQAELTKLQQDKQLEIDLSIQEQRRYLQVVVQQQQAERVEREAIEKKEEEERQKREAEQAIIQQKEAEDRAKREMEAEWARLQAIMARDKAAKQERLRLDQERAEARLGVRVKTAGADSIGETGSGEDGAQSQGSKKKIGKKPSKIPKKAASKAKDAASVGSQSPTKSLSLGSSVALHSSNQQELAYASQISKAASGVNVSVLAGMGMGAGAGAAIFASQLSKEEKLQQLKQLAENRDNILSQGTATAYSMTNSGEMIPTGSSGNPLGSLINPLAASQAPGRNRYQHGDATAFQTALDPVIKFSRKDRAVPLTGATPKGPGAGEAARVKAVRDSANLLAMLADAKKQHLEQVETIYTEKQPKLVLGQRHADTPGLEGPVGGPRGASGGGGRPGSTNAYRAFTPDDRSLSGIKLIRNTINDVFEDDHADGMQLSVPAVSEEEAAAQSTRYDGRPDVSYIHPPDRNATTPSGTSMIVRTGQYMLDRRLPDSPGPLSPNASLYGNGGMSIKSYPHIPQNDGTVGRVTETQAAKIQKEKGFGLGNTNTNTGSSTSLINHQTDLMISQEIAEELKDVQTQRVSKMSAQEKSDFEAYHGAHQQQKQVLGTLGSGLDASSVLSTDNITSHTGIMKALPNFVSRPIKHLTATGSTSLGITARPRTGSPDVTASYQGAIPAEAESLSLLDQSPFATVKSPAAQFKCPHPGCTRSYTVAFELFNHANKAHLGVIGDLARDPSNLQDYYFKHDKMPQGAALAAIRSQDQGHTTKILSHANSPSHRIVDPFRATAAPQPLGTKAFVKKIRIPADQVIDRGPRSKGSKLQQPSTRGSRAVALYNNTADNSSARISPNKNTHFDMNFLSPTMGSTGGERYAEYQAESEMQGYNSTAGGQSTNAFVANSYHAMNKAKAKFVAKQEQHIHMQKQSLSPSSKGGNYGTPVPLGQFNPAVVSLSKKWEEQQQMQSWTEHTKLLKDWRQTYEKQLSLEAKALPTGPLATRTRDKFVPKAGVGV